MASLWHLPRDNVSEGGVAIGPQREVDLGLEATRRHREHQRVERELPAGERAGIAQAGELIAVGDVEDGDAAAVADEVVVVKNQATAGVGDLVVEGDVRVVWGERTRRDRVDEVAALEFFSAIAAHRTTSPTVPPRQRPRTAPPLTCRKCPVTYAASSDARK